MLLLHYSVIHGGGQCNKAFWKKFNVIFLQSWIPCKQCDQIGRFITLWQLFKAHGNNYFAHSANWFLAIFVNLSKSFIFLAKSFLGNFYWHLGLFTGHTACKRNPSVWLRRSHWPRAFGCKILFFTKTSEHQLTDLNRKHLQTVFHSIDFFVRE